MSLDNKRSLRSAEKVCYLLFRILVIFLPSISKPFYFLFFLFSLFSSCVATLIFTS